MRVVAKIGTSSITTADGHIDLESIHKLTAEIADLRAAGHDVLLVSSGAVAAGVAALGFTSRPTDVLTLQAVSAVGQTRLMRVYNDDLAAYDLVGAQVLLDPHDFVDRTQYLHARNTLGRLLELGCVPIINENDAVASDELRYGDNDRIAALVANSVSADVLVLLTDTDGVYTSDPRRDAASELIPFVAADDPLLSIAAGDGGSGRGSGGMASKLTAARMASWSGIRCVIARADRADVVAGAVSDDLVGTTFEAHVRTLSARKLWLGFAAEVVGAVRVDAGAQRALTERPVSLLPAGVTEISAGFATGDVIDVVGADGTVFARGRASVNARELRSVLGSRTSDLPAGMVHEVIHRDDLVVLST